MNPFAAEAGWGPAAVAAVAALVVAVAGGLATNTDAWYRALRVPAWKPPDWAFGPVWTVIFLLTTTAGVLAWNGDPDPAARGVLLAAYAVNGVLNIAWSVLFFRFRRPDWALAEVVALWLSIAVLVLVTGRVGLAAGLMNLPYLAWVSVAACLNLRIVRLNPPFRAA
ncbi:MULTISPECIES: TspO/MBR family protein [Methylobacterium]|uniref:TspO/MBR family protein n=1 Tax=Methylobacterium longum TaxID=767694 RepID=A0ABT8AUQ3_9HYPH|nr:MULTISPECIES: TspO/MBR family protein [Methylobacterium]MCJ2098082.1 tryptophan-rich sensory protein [Methylobacterium sp. E-046]MDN3573544.1 TspO/MBR family protein [Methylobacterium longum]GJE10221.1 Tryptophan-rich protein TspO [Methylobacterium longum]